MIISSDTDFSPTVDHVVVAGSDLEQLVATFEAVGFMPSYGGVHSNGVTHNYTVGFDDGSYIELISTIKSKQKSPWWETPIRDNAGPCAWALPTTDIETETARIADQGISVDGPSHYTRERPDGVLIKWDLTDVGDRELGATFPFLVQDHTPREYRITPSGNLKNTEIVGITEVVVAVADLEAEIESFQRFFETGSPQRFQHADLGADLARFPEAPVTLAEPVGKGTFHNRFNHFGPLPCAYLLKSDDFAATTDRFDLSSSRTWGDNEVHWFNVAITGWIGILS